MNRPVLIAVTFAVGAEFGPWRRRRRFRRCAGASIDGYEARLGAVDLRVALTGMGQRAAGAVLESLFQDRPDVCIASGMAGGLNPALRVGDIVASARVRDPEGRRIDSDPRLLALAVRRGATAVNLFSSSLVVCRAEEKRRMSDSADAVDMETATILRESRRLDIPSIAIRAISDPATASLPLDFNQAVTHDGCVSSLRVLAAVARRPHATPALMRLGIDARRAGTALATFLDDYVQQVAMSMLANPERATGT